MTTFRKLPRIVPRMNAMTVDTVWLITISQPTQSSQSTQPTANPRQEIPKRGGIAEIASIASIRWARAAPPHGVPQGPAGLPLRSAHRQDGAHNGTLRTHA